MTTLTPGAPERTAPPRRDRPAAWALAGFAAGTAGLVVSHVVAELLTVRESPVVAVAEWIIELTPGPVVHWAIELVGTWDKPLLVGGILVALAVGFAAAGLLSRGARWRGTLLLLALAGIGAAAIASRPGWGVLDLLPLAAGLVTWLLLLSWLVVPLERPAGLAAERDVPGERRRTFLVRTGVVLGLAAVGGVLGRLLGAGRRQVERTRRLVRLEGATRPPVPDGATLGVRGIVPWRTPEDDFYLIHTAISVPTIDPAQWRLRIHGMVDNEITLGYQDLLDRELTEGWITLNCVSNPVGGDLIGNAWWSGVRIADLLAEAGVRSGADAVLQTSEDGWTCGTPLSALTDDRNAMLAVAMNGRVLPFEHGFPVRMIVPGLYGFVSATKWLVDIEVTRFDRISAYWTERGWAEQAPVRLASRIDVPADGASVPAGPVQVGGVAWQQHTGVSAVQVAVDGSAWQDVEIADSPIDSWVQWAGTVDLAPGEHELRVRARGADGTWQTGAVRDVVPDGATGWHSVTVEAEG